MNPDTSMDYYLASPLEGAKSPGNNGNQSREDANKEREFFAAAHHLNKLTIAKPRMTAFHCPH